MTLIAGFNFSNRLYLVSDTRITFSPDEYQDNLDKVTTIWGKLVQPQDFYDSNEISVAISGNVEFAAFFVEKVQIALGRKELSTDIRLLREEIEEFAKKVVIEWCLVLKKDNKNAKFIFAGINHDIHIKKISVDRYKRLFDIFLSNFKNKIRLIKPGQKIFNEKIIFPPQFKSFTQENKDYAIAPDSSVFMLGINMETGVFVKEIECGEFIAAGSCELTKEKIPDDIFAELEFNYDLRDLRKQAEILGSIWFKIFDTKIFSEIGGTVLIYVMKERNESNQSCFLISKLMVENSKLYISDRGEKKELISFNNFKDLNRKNNLNAVI